MTAFVLGNGISRQQIPTKVLLTLGDVYGCNAIYRTENVNVLVATDQPIARKIQESGYSLKNKFYTRRPLKDLGALRVPQEYFGFSSGPIAAAIAAADKHNRIYLIGFDMGPTVVGTFNNVYAGTEFYKEIGAPPTYTGNWTNQICKVMNDFPKQRFIRVHGETTADITQLENITNHEKLPIASFLDRINNKKDL